MGVITILSLVLFIVPVIITGFLFDFELDISSIIIKIKNRFIFYTKKNIYCIIIWRGCVVV